MLIYDPQLERAFCKDFIVNLNQKEDMYPEYPMRDGLAPPKKQGYNVWRKWLEDSQEDIFKSFSYARSQSNDFIVAKFIRDPIDAEKSLNILQENFDIIKIYQKHLMYNSEKHPLADWKRVWYHIETINTAKKKVK